VSTLAIIKHFKNFPRHYRDSFPDGFYFHNVGPIKKVIKERLNTSKKERNYEVLELHKDLSCKTYGMNYTFFEQCNSVILQGLSLAKLQRMNSPEKLIISGNSKHVVLITIESFVKSLKHLKLSSLNGIRNSFYTTYKVRPESASDINMFELLILSSILKKDVQLTLKTMKFYLSYHKFNASKRYSSIMFKTSAYSTKRRNSATGVKEIFDSSFKLMFKFMNKDDVQLVYENYRKNISGQISSDYILYAKLNKLGHPRGEDIINTFLDYVDNKPKKVENLPDIVKLHFKENKIRFSWKKFKELFEIYIDEEVEKGTISFKKYTIHEILSGRSLPNKNKNELYFFWLEDYLNKMRTDLGLKTSVMKYKGEWFFFSNLKREFPKLLIKHQWSPKWLSGMRIDVSIPSLKIAIEYNGEQHYRPIEFFGGREMFVLQKKRDTLKKKKCSSNGVKLFIVKYNEDLDTALDKIKLFVEKKIKKSMK
jgi:hypothetical protein